VSLDISVSVCIPVLNGVPYIGATLDSVAAQTFRDFELIISDNFSADETAEVIDAWRKKHPSIACSVVRPPRQLGMLEHWLFAVGKARGRYVKLLMADDLLEPDCLEAQVAALRENPGVMLVSGPRTVIAPDGTQLFSNKSLPSGCSYTLKEVCDRISREGINVVGEPSVVMYRRSSIMDADPQFLRGFPYVCDLALHLWSLRTGDLWFDSRSLARFRVHGKASTVQDQGLVLHGLERLLDAYSSAEHRAKLSFFGKARARLRLHSRRLVYWWAEKFHPLCSS